MDWRAALRDRLINDAPLAALVATRIYLAERPQASTLPALVLVIVADERPTLLREWDYPPGRVQFDAYADDLKEAWGVAEAALAAAVMPAAWQGHSFSHAEVSMGPRDTAERAANATVFRVSMDLVLHHVPI